MTPTPDQIRMTRRMAPKPDGSHGMSQTALAELMDVSAQTLAAWENGTRPMPAWRYSFLLWTLGRQ